MFDLIIFCLGQETISIPKNKVYIEAEQRYSDLWKFISAQKGIWYNLYISENEFGGTELCVHLGFDTKSTLPEVPNACSEITDCLTTYKFNENYIEDVKKIIEFYIESSPMKTVFCLGRYQSEEKEIVRGTYTIEKFFSLMQAGEIYANICYIISENANALS